MPDHLAHYSQTGTSSVYLVLLELDLPTPAFNWMKICKQPTHQSHRSLMRPVTAPISTFCICQSAPSDMSSFWHALQYIYALTTLWQLASTENTNTIVNNKSKLFSVKTT